MKDKKTLNLGLSVVIAMCGLICIVLSILCAYIWGESLGEETIIEKTVVEWRAGAPLITFAALGTLLTIVKMFTCSVSHAKSSEKTLGIVAIICDIVLVIGFILIVAGIASYDGKTFGEGESDDMRHLIINVITLVSIGAPMMLAGGVGSWIANHKAAE